MSYSQEGVLTFLFPNKEMSSSHFDLVEIFQRSQAKKFTVQEWGTREENQRRAHDFPWFAKEKIKEAQRQSERHQGVRGENNAFTSLSKRIKPPEGNVPLNKGGRDKKKTRTIKILSRPHCKLEVPSSLCSLEMSDTVSFPLIIEISRLTTGS